MNFDELYLIILKIVLSSLAAGLFVKILYLINNIEI